VLEADGATRALELARMGAATDDTHRVAALVAESGSEMNAGASLHARLESQLGRSLPAVLMSAHAGVMPASGTTERVRVLQKPFEITELVEVLEAVLAANDPDASAC
jgi:FixJ family two-component response regulator